ncbi:MAG: metallophosphoesterase [Thermoleophilaceae bacterium]
MADDHDSRSTVRVAAAGDLHCREANRDRIAAAFAALNGAVDLVLLAGDMTTHGQVAQARLLAEAAAEAEPPIFAVLGNHDHHCAAGDSIAGELRAGGIEVLERDYAIVEIDDVEVGVVGVKGFVGGFAGSHLPDFGEPLLREVYAETSREVEALDRGLAAVAHCALRLVVMHYAPIAETLAGEPEGIYTMLGSSRLGHPIREHEPDLVVHGHAHAGSFAGTLGNVPVHNVSVPVMDQDFWIFELPIAARSLGY